MHYIVGTAGHVDHGKTSLIRALTGMETDRLREEKERGLSIVPGFAHMTLPDQRVVGIVDVPGHERFLKNMLTGISGVDIAMLVIAADEGVMPQTLEHLHVLELLRVKRGIVVLTKTDLVDAEWLLLAEEDVRSRLADTAFATSKIVPVSAITGQGLEQLKTEVAAICDSLDKENHEDSKRAFRLAIDRAFTVSGFGTVVTGSAAAGSVIEGSNVEVWRPDAASAVTCRVRGIEVHGSIANRAEAGQRTALNLTGLDLQDTIRGGTVAAPGSVSATKLLDAWVEVLGETRRDIRDDATLRLHLGTSEVGARLQLFDGARLRPGDKAFARLRLESPLVCARGDRFVLREVSSERVLGGGLVIEPASAKSRAKAREGLPQMKLALDSGEPLVVAELLLQRAGANGLDCVELGRELLLVDPGPLIKELDGKGVLRPLGGVLLHTDAVADLVQNFDRALVEYHKVEPLRVAMPRELLRAAVPQLTRSGVFDALVGEMESAKQIVAESAGIRKSSHSVQLDRDTAAMQEQLESRAYRAAWQPLTVSELLTGFSDRETAGKLYRELVQQGRLVRVGDFVLSGGRVEEGATKLREHFKRSPHLTVGDARELLETTRKWAVPLLEYYDRIGVTQRDGEVRLLKS